MLLMFDVRHHRENATPAWHVMAASERAASNWHSADTLSEALTAARQDIRSRISVDEYLALESLSTYVLASSHSGVGRGWFTHDEMLLASRQDQLVRELDEFKLSQEKLIQWKASIKRKLQALNEKKGTTFSNHVCYAYIGPEPKKITDRLESKKKELQESIKQASKFLSIKPIRVDVCEGEITIKVKDLLKVAKRYES